MLIKKRSTIISGHARVYYILHTKWNYCTTNIIRCDVCRRSETKIYILRFLNGMESKVEMFQIRTFVGVLKYPYFRFFCKLRSAEVAVRDFFWIKKIDRNPQCWTSPFFKMSDSIGDLDWDFETFKSKCSRKIFKEWEAGGPFPKLVNFSSFSFWTAEHLFYVFSCFFFITTRVVAL
jgi:hypothetical protein